MIGQQGTTTTANMSKSDNTPPLLGSQQGWHGSGTPGAHLRRAYAAHPFWT
jgi:hypothetical protein